MRGDLPQTRPTFLAADARIDRSGRSSFCSSVLVLRPRPPLCNVRGTTRIGARSREDSARANRRAFGGGVDGEVRDPFARTTSGMGGRGEGLIPGGRSRLRVRGEAVPAGIFLRALLRVRPARGATGRLRTVRGRQEL